MWASGLDHCIQLILQEGQCRGEGLPAHLRPLRFPLFWGLPGSSRHRDRSQRDRFQEPCLCLSQCCEAVTLVHCCAFEIEIVYAVSHSLRSGSPPFTDEEVEV